MQYAQTGSGEGVREQGYMVLYILFIRVATMTPLAKDLSPDPPLSGRIWVQE